MKFRVWVEKFWGNFGMGRGRDDELERNMMKTGRLYTWIESVPFEPTDLDTMWERIGPRNFLLLKLNNSRIKNK